MPRGSAKCPQGCTCRKHAHPGPGPRGQAARRPPKINWNDPEARRAYNRQKAAERYAADPEPMREASRRYRQANPGRRGRLHDDAAALKYMYGITPERRQQMIDSQNGCCYLCGDPLDTERKHGTHVDHDHDCCAGRRSCGACVRGIAHGLCNAASGAFGDNPERLRRAADNLEAANRRVRAGRVTAQGQLTLPPLGLGAKAGPPSPRASFPVPG